MRYLAIGVKSGVNLTELNYLLNPYFPMYAQLVKVKEVEAIHMDQRFVREPNLLAWDQIKGHNNFEII